jgi:hypothetical protein
VGKKVNGSEAEGQGKKKEGRPRGDNNEIREERGGFQD